MKKEKISGINVVTKDGKKVEIRIILRNGEIRSLPYSDEDLLTVKEKFPMAPVDTYSVEELLEEKNKPKEEEDFSIFGIIKSRFKRGSKEINEDELSSIENADSSEDTKEEDYYSERDREFAEEGKKIRKRIIIFGTGSIILGSLLVHSALSGGVLQRKGPINEPVVIPTPPAIEIVIDESPNAINEPVIVVDSFDELKDLLKKDEYHLDPNDPNSYQKVIVELQNQLLKENGAVVSNADLLTIALLSNNIHPGDINIFENVVKPLYTILNVDVAEAANSYANVTRINDDRTVITPEILSFKKTDRAFVKAFTDKKALLINAIYDGKRDEADKLIEEIFHLICVGLIDEKAIDTEHGKISIGSVGEMQKFMVVSESLRIAGIIEAAKGNYTVTYDAVLDLNSDAKETYSLLEVVKELQAKNNVIGTNIKEQIEKSLLQEPCDEVKNEKERN